MKKSTLLVLFFIFLLNYENSWSQCFYKNQSRLGEYDVFDETDNYYFNEVIKSTNDFLSKILKLDVKYGFYDDGKNPNAFAMSINHNYYDGQTYFGVNLLREIANKNNFNSDTYNVYYILAHEYAHILQYKKNYFFNEPKYTELQADFISGYITAELSVLKFNSKSPEEYLMEGAKLFEKLGDTEFGSPQHHGTPEERAHAYLNGALIFIKKEQTNKRGYFLTPSEIWEKSLSYINSIK